MNKPLTTLLTILKKNQYLIAAFLITLSVRSIPEILSWPYPLGLDTLRYIPLIERSWVFSLGPVGFLHTPAMFYLLTSLPYGLTHDAILTIKLLGPLLLAGLSSVMFLYARKGLGWSNRKSLLVSILVATYFVALRNSWDLYRQTLGLIFLVSVFVALKSFSSPRKYYVAGVLMMLTVLSHELPSVILFFAVILEATWLLVKKSKREAAYLAISASLAIAIFFFQRISLQQATFTIPVDSAGSVPSVALALHMVGLLVYCYVLLLPFVFVGLLSLKDSFLRYWALLCVGIVVLKMFGPDLPFYFWNRWVYLLVYPLLFFAAHGIARLWKLWSNHKSRVRSFAPKAFALAYLFMLLTFSGYYLTTVPETSFSYFSQYNPYLTYIPSAMLQNTISIKDNPALTDCLRWLNENADADSAVVAHYALYDLARISVSGPSVVAVRNDPNIWVHIQNETTLADGMVETAKKALADDYVTVYTIWWVEGKGWYQISSLPAVFKEVYRTGDMAVYLFGPQ